MFPVPSLPDENRGERLGEFKSRSVKTRDHLLENSHKLYRSFHQAMKENFHLGKDAQIGRAHV